MKALRSTPSLPVADIPAAEAFVRNCLGFETVYREEKHALCQRDAAFVRFINAPPDANMDDPDAFHRAYHGALEALPDRHFRAPFNQEYGQREMHVIHGPFLFILGQPIEEPAP